MAERYPEYSLWLRAGRVDPANGEISPDGEGASQSADKSDVR